MSGYLPVYGPFYVVESCPNRANPYHECSIFCRDTYASSSSSSSSKKRTSSSSSYSSSSSSSSSSKLVKKRKGSGVLSCPDDGIQMSLFKCKNGRISKEDTTQNLFSLYKNDDHAEDKLNSSSSSSS